LTVLEKTVYSGLMIDTAIIEKQAMQLPDVDRALLADRLIESLSRVPEMLKDAWVAESDSRMAAYRNGDIAAVDGPKAMAELRSRREKGTTAS
jgi:putative addiction module component (TIGR02574 family)